MDRADIRIFKPIRKTGQAVCNLPIPASKIGNSDGLFFNLPVIAGTDDQAGLVNEPECEQRVVENLSMKKTDLMRPSQSGSGRIPRGTGLVNEIEQLMAIEIRTELLERLKDVQSSVIRRLRICRSCGKLFVASKKGGNAKRCSICRDLKRRLP